MQVMGTIDYSAVVVVSCNSGFFHPLDGFRQIRHPLRSVFGPFRVSHHRDLGDLSSQRAIQAVNKHSPPFAKRSLRNL
ncbi:hypothetical protein QR680_005389 [Steinernema hermaphroditum]|uniref:Uncharacterized protein n=1 Tax=Steinernema hermaphroditum TaxID=289476 RepID=A0AA39HT25_9BILA|nr:hypothetical protein QR680_005389 [Steinernema hermaphroditum]